MPETTIKLVVSGRELSPRCPSQPSNECVWPGHTPLQRAIWEGENLNRSTPKPYPFYTSSSLHLYFIIGKVFTSHRNYILSLFVSSHISFVCWLFISEIYLPAVHQTLEIYFLIIFLNLRTGWPPTEPRNGKSGKYHFWVQKMHTKFFLHKLFEHPQGSGTSRQNSLDIPDSSLRNPRKTNFRGRARSFRPPPLRVEDPPPTPPGGLRTRKVYLCALFSCLNHFWVQKMDFWGAPLGAI